VPATPPSTGIPSQAKLLLAFMWFAYFLNYCDRQAVFSMFPRLKSDLGFTDSQLGLVGSTFLWVYGLSSFVAGQIGDRFSKRHLIVLSISLWSLVTVATGLSTSPTMVLSLRALMGVSEALFMPVAIALTANAFPPEHRSRAIATLTTAQIFGSVGGGWFGGWMAQQGQWRGAFFVLGAIGLVYAIPYFAFIRKVPEEVQDQPRTERPTNTLAMIARTPTYWVLCAAFSTFVFGLWLLYGWLPNFLHERFSLDLSAAAFNATVFLQGATLAGLLLGGIVADRLYHRTKAARLWLLAASLLGCAPCLHAVGVCDTLLTTRFAAAGFGLLSGFFMGNIFPSTFEVVPAQARASAVGLMNLFGAVISGFGTLFGGLWKQSVGIASLLSYTALAYALVALLVIAGIKRTFPRDFQRTH
jgi:MFS family permease